MFIQSAVSYILYAPSSRGKTGDIIITVQFKDVDLLYETWNLLSEPHDDPETGNKSDDDSTLPPLINEEEIDVMASGDESDSEPMSTEILEDTRDGSQFHTSINSREARYKIHDCIKQGQVEYKRPLLSMRNMGKGLHKLFKAVVNELLESLPILGESGS